MTDKTNITIGKNAPDFLAKILIETAKENGEVNIQDSREVIPSKPITLKDYPKLIVAHEFVSKVKNSVIAGGAARDILTGREFKDIDIFVSTTGTSDLAKEVANVVEFCINKKMKIEPVVSKYGDGIANMGGAKITGLIKAGSLDFVFMTPFSGGKEIVSGFDMVSSQAWLEPTEEGFNVKAFELFHQLDEKKVLGIYPDKADYRFSHIERIQEKYPDYLPLELHVKPEASEAKHVELNDEPGSNIPF